MKNGFTLVELLAIMVLLGVIILVAIPSVINSNKVAKENDQKEFVDAINTACESYAAVNSKTDGSVTINELLNGGYLKKSLKNPNTGKEISSMGSTAITITSSGCNYTYQP